MNYLLVTQKLKDLGWTWIHPRMSAYIVDLNKVYNRRFEAHNLPEKHYVRLMNILSCFERINQELKLRSISWNDPMIVDFFNEFSMKDKGNSPTNRLKLKQWLELERIICDATCPF